MCVPLVSTRSHKFSSLLPSLIPTDSASSTSHPYSGEVSCCCLLDVCCQNLSALFLVQLWQPRGPLTSLYSDLKLSHRHFAIHILLSLPKTAAESKTPLSFTRQQAPWRIRGSLSYVPKSILIARNVTLSQVYQLTYSPQLISPTPPNTSHWPYFCF